MYIVVNTEILCTLYSTKKRKMKHVNQYNKSIHININECDESMNKKIHISC